MGAASCQQGRASWPDSQSQKPLDSKCIWTHSYLHTHTHTHTHAWVQDQVQYLTFTIYRHTSIYPHSQVSTLSVDIYKVPEHQLPPPLGPVPAQCRYNSVWPQGHAQERRFSPLHLLLGDGAWLRLCFFCAQESCAACFSALPTPSLHPEHTTRTQHAPIAILVLI